MTCVFFGNINAATYYWITNLSFFPGVIVACRLLINPAKKWNLYHLAMVIENIAQNCFEIFQRQKGFCPEGKE